MRAWAIILIVLGIVAVLLGAVILAAAFLPRVQRFLIYLPPCPPKWVVPLHDPSRLGLLHGRPVAIPTAGGGVLRGWHVPPPGPPFAPVPPPPPPPPPQPSGGWWRAKGAAPAARRAAAVAAADAAAAAVDTHLDGRLATDGRPVLLYCHGHAGSRATPPSRVAFVRDVAAVAAVHIVSWDPRGCGDSSRVALSEATQREDAAAAAAWVATRLAGETLKEGDPKGIVHDAYGRPAGAGTPAEGPPAAPSAAAAAAARSRLVVYGHSLGSSIALAAAAAVPPAGVVLSGAVASLPVAADGYPAVAALRVVPPLWAALRGRLVDAHDNEAAVRRLGCPLLLFHNPADRVVRPSNSERLRDAAAAAGVDVAYVPTPGVGHKRGWVSPPFFPTLVPWLARVTGEGGEGGAV